MLVSLGHPTHASASTSPAGTDGDVQCEEFGCVRVELWSDDDTIGWSIVGYDFSWGTVNVDGIIYGPDGEIFFDIPPKTCREGQGCRSESVEPHLPNCRPGRYVLVGNAWCREDPQTWLVSATAEATV